MQWNHSHTPKWGWWIQPWSSIFIWPMKNNNFSGVILCSHLTSQFLTPHGWFVRIPFELLFFLKSPSVVSFESETSKAEWCPWKIVSVWLQINSCPWFDATHHTISPTQKGCPPLSCLDLQCEPILHHVFPEPFTVWWHVLCWALVVSANLDLLTHQNGSKFF